MKPDHQKPVTLEDLLRLKRAERPAPEFWPQFERELRAKQLAALVVKRPWWRTLPGRALAGFSRYHLPLGATAVLALTFLSVREYQTAAPERGVMPGLVDETAVNVAATAPRSETVAALSPAPSADTGSVESVAETLAQNDAASVAVHNDASGAGRISAMAALIGGSVEQTAVSSPSARSIAENFAAAQSDDNTFGGRALLASAVQGFESRAMPASRTPMVDPLAQMKAPSDVRRARYLGTALPVVAHSRAVAPRSSERLASRISDDRLYETLGSRLGLGGDRLMVKF